MSQTINYYKLLQVHYGAPKEAIAASYRRLCKIYHPDVNPGPEAEEIMKQLNLAYEALCEEKVCKGHSRDKGGTGRSYADSDVVSARACMNRYFSALLKGDYAAAFMLVSDYDKKYVTLQSYCEWRKSVQKLFSMREFSIKTTSGVFVNRLKADIAFPTVSHLISITEKNTVVQTVNSYNVSKNAILGPEGWRVFLGYRDLSEIAKVFEDLSAEQERGEMTRHWEEYCGNTCRELNMLSLGGLLKKASSEVYRCRRYRQQMVVACFRVRPVSAQRADEASAKAVEAAARTITASLRETDIPAYLGGGIFAVLFVELKKKYAPLITTRILNSLKGHVLREARLRVYAECNFLQYTGGELAEYIEKCSAF